MRQITLENLKIAPLINIKNIDDEKLQLITNELQERYSIVPNAFNERGMILFLDELDCDIHLIYTKDRGILLELDDSLQYPIEIVDTNFIHIFNKYRENYSINNTNVNHYLFRQRYTIINAIKGIEPNVSYISLLNSDGYSICDEYI